MPIPPPSLISGRDNPEFRRFLAVRARKNRDLILVEGPKLIDEAIRSRLNVRAIGLLATRKDTSPGWDGFAQFRFAAPLMKSLSDVETNQGVLALAERPRPSRAFLEEPAAFVLVLDGLQDPGNVGTLFRTAEAAGVSGVLLTRGCADPLSAKALRASAGSAFRLPHVSDLAPGAVRDLLTSRIPMVAAVAGTVGRSVFEAPLDLPIALALGSEGSGLEASLEAGAALRLTVPSVRPVESLNVAAAGAIVMFEIARRAGHL